MVYHHGNKENSYSMKLFTTRSMDYLQFRVFLFFSFSSFFGGGLWASQAKCHLVLLYLSGGRHCYSQWLQNSTIRTWTIRRINSSKDKREKKMYFGLYCLVNSPFKAFTTICALAHSVSSMTYHNSDVADFNQTPVCTSSLYELDWLLHEWHHWICLQAVGQLDQGLLIKMDWPRY